ncbi:lipid IV(A) 3-deoxy-D-manno-octulosonic acid transferase [Methylophaga thalassica]|uniref:lipid IV(A) 3-deoxy-D-manno-octulosonic acid transferase n=1 Tax=Methylophaga thalassica TaxID=40223 RepID=UPI0036174446
MVAAIQSTYPEHQILITTMTPTGSTRVKALYADNVIHCYLPYDLPVIMRRFIQAIQPVFGVIMETELWPNLIHHCRKQNIPLVLANARMSERSLKGYQRIPSLTREILQSFTVIAAQAQQDRERFIELGADRDKVHAVGNLKFEVNLSPTIVEQAEAIRSMWGNRSVFIAASTHEGEDEIILNASRQIRAQVPDLLLIIVPRHPERFDKVAALCQRAGFKILRRSENGLCRSDIQILVIDSMGELPIFYACSDIAFVGGSLVPTGGHNILEPAALSRPVIVGPHVFNFAEITQQFITAQAAIQVGNAEMLATTVIELLKNPPKRTAMGEAGQQLIKQSQGGSQRLLNLIKYNIHV